MCIVHLMNASLPSLLRHQVVDVLYSAFHPRHACCEVSLINFNDTCYCYSLVTSSSTFSPMKNIRDSPHSFFSNLNSLMSWARLRQREWPNAPNPREIDGHSQIQSSMQGCLLLHITQVPWGRVRLPYMLT